MEEKPKRTPRRPNPAQDIPCHICGGENFTWGSTVADRPGGRTYFRADGAGWGGGIEMRARRCDSCGNVQLFAK